MRTTRKKHPLAGSGAWLSAALLSMAVAGPVSAGNIEAGKAAAAVCVACHQADGSGLAAPGVEPWPALAGLDAGYLVKQLHDFKSGARENISMQPFAQMLNDTQISDVAAYYASLPLPARALSVQPDSDLLKHGETLASQGDWDRYVVSCVACHGPGNGGVGSEFPRLAGQLPEYLREQLLAYRDGARNNDPQGLMGSIARRMSDRDIDAVSIWLGSQPAPQVRK